MAVLRDLLRKAAPLGVALPLLAPAAELEAQRNPDLELRDVFDRASRGTQIRVHLTDGTELQGPLADRGDDRVWLDDSPAVPFEQIEQVWIRGRGTRRGAIIGVIGLGVLGGVLLGYDCAEEGAELDCSVPTATIIGTLAGAAAGFALGTAIGTAFPQWHLRFP